MAQVPTPEEIQRSSIDARSRAQSQADHPLPAAQFIIQPRHRFAETLFGFQWGNQAFTTTIRHGAPPVDVANALSALSNEILRGAVASETWLDRVKAEHRELTVRMKALAQFFADGYPGMEKTEDIAQLNEQYLVMENYRAILAARIENIEHETRPGAERRPPMEGLEDGSAIRETGGHDQDRDGPVKFGD